MTNIRPDIVIAIRDTLAHPRLESFVAKPVTLDYWPVRGAGLPAVLIDRSHVTPDSRGASLHLGPISVARSACAIGIARHESVFWMVTGFGRAICLSTFEPVHTRKYRRVFGRYLWRIGK